MARKSIETPELVKQSRVKTTASEPASITGLRERIAQERATKYNSDSSLSHTKGWKGTLAFPLIGTVIGMFMKSEQRKQYERQSAAEIAKETFAGAKKSYLAGEISKEQLEGYAYDAGYTDKKGMQSPGHVGTGFALFVDDILTALLAIILYPITCLFRNPEKPAQKAGEEEVKNCKAGLQNRGIPEWQRNRER